MSMADRGDYDAWVEDGYILGAKVVRGLSPEAAREKLRTLRGAIRPILGQVSESRLPSPRDMRQFYRHDPNRASLYATFMGAKAVVNHRPRQFRRPPSAKPSSPEKGVQPH